MSLLSAEQRSLLASVHEQLDAHGLSHLLLLDRSSPSLYYDNSAPTSATAASTSSGASLSVASSLAADHPRTPYDPAISAVRYVPPSARAFSPHEKALGHHKITRQTAANQILRHPPDAVVEYPQSGDLAGSVMHVFPISPTSPRNPRDDFQYSFDKGHGAHENKTCPILQGSDGNPVLCREWHGTCKSILSTCATLTILCRCLSQDVFVLPVSANTVLPRIPLEPAFDDTQKRLFLKTFDFYCALMKRGCHFCPDTTELDEDLVSLATKNELDALSVEQDVLPVDPRAPKAPRCKGKLVMFQQDTRHFIQCSERKPGAQGHLLVYGVEQYDIGYLRALVSGDNASAERYELRAARGGYGPLVPCSRVASPGSQAICSDWHRVRGGNLRPYAMVPASNCTSSSRIFTPYNLAACPFVVALCSGAHSHPDPPPTQTPTVIREFFCSLLRDLDWQIISATPRRLMLNMRFIQQLRVALAWQHRHHPILADIHPSLGNADHAAYFIDQVRCAEFPHGTSFNGIQHLLTREASLEASLRYVRAVEEVVVGGAMLRYVVCMYPEQSKILFNSNYITIDTAFKRVRGWYELELETWDDSGNRSITCARVFFNSQTAEAHEAVLTKVTEIAESDCGFTIRIAYMHGRGIKLMLADEHRGEALGVGGWLLSIARRTLDRASPFARMTPYAHLAYFYLLCIFHFKRNVKPYKTRVAPEVYNAMLSLASSEALPDLDATLAVIRGGGKAAQGMSAIGRCAITNEYPDWLKDKLSAEMWPLRALYQPLSNIPLDVWKAAPRTTNGNEQAHHNVNLDGTQLALVAGIMYGAEFDNRLLSTRRAAATSGVNTRYHVSHGLHRATRGLVHMERESRRRLTVLDSAIDDAQTTVQDLMIEARHHSAVLTSHTTAVPAQQSSRKRLRELDASLDAQEETLRKAFRPELLARFFPSASATAWQAAASVGGAPRVSRRSFGGRKVRIDMPPACSLPFASPSPSPSPVTSTSALAFKSALATYNLSPAHILPHGSYLLNLGNPSEAKRQQSYDCFLDDLKRAEQLGLQLYNFHPGSTTGGCTKEESIGWIAENVNRALKETSGVTIVLENMAGQGNVIGSTFEDLRDIIALVEDKSRVGVCLDTFRDPRTQNIPLVLETPCDDEVDLGSVWRVEVGVLNELAADRGTQKAEVDVGLVSSAAGFESSGFAVPLVSAGTATNGTLEATPMADSVAAIVHAAPPVSAPTAAAVPAPEATDEQIVEMEARIKLAADKANVKKAKPKAKPKAPADGKRKRGAKKDESDEEEEEEH
ncbi:hypothetical protein EXIGLDRAFT_776848 [Exidia glandulosa HHB12029]|uniref:Xylose isomerase-like TIM barrel domain-containing protein n=1 Tax=Exidia glandulosa HHB12029 TaxID=1314781 RepID=A0A165DB99_EXIGL|nr:hypothetical protein EXIGLDRAFT_776848 [Exidia glandulosa HHB12029]